jgi:hypothetical protein
VEWDYYRSHALVSMRHIVARESAKVFACGRIDAQRDCGDARPR